MTNSGIPKHTGMRNLKNNLLTLGLFSFSQHYALNRCVSQLKTFRCLRQTHTTFITEMIVTYAGKLNYAKSKILIFQRRNINILYTQ